ncbi:MAG TPA: transcriptional repressor LexA [Anaerolineales bacterium]
MPRKKKDKLSDRERLVLGTVENFQGENGYPPSIREICKQADISSTSVVSYYLDNLEDKGYIERDNKVSRGIRVLKPIGDAVSGVAEEARKAVESLLRVPVVGRIQAGAAIPIPETDFALYDAETTVEIPAGLLPKRAPADELFALEVQGDSMIDAMVNDGDIVVLRKTEDIRNGDMIAAWLDKEKETTLKYLFHENGGVRLQPANPNYEAVRLDDPEALIVQGKVVLVIRQVEH